MGHFSVEWVYGPWPLPSYNTAPVLRDLHWLPITRRVEYKILVLVYRALNGTGPEYIHQLLTVQEGVYDLRSVHNVVHLKEPRTKLVTDDRSLENAAACQWNCTPVSLRNTDSLKYLNVALNDIYMRSLIPKRYIILCSYISLLTDYVMHW